MEKYGVSPENYAETQVAESLLESVGKRIISPIYDSEEYQQELENENNAREQVALDTIKQQGEKVPESTIARQDLGNTLLAGLGKDLRSTNNSLQSLEKRIKDQHDEDKRKAEERDRNERIRDKEARKAMRDLNYKSNFDY